MILLQFLIAENTRGICRVIATNVPTVVERYLDHDEVAELGDRGVAVTVLEQDLIRDQAGEITSETRAWLQQLVSSFSSASSSDSPPQEVSSQSEERETGSFGAASVDNFLGSINQKRGTP
tara:strand:- start:501 stop:863 length:363 start_codon:yes stop_codon:yes gene_type:complete